MVKDNFSAFCRENPNKASQLAEIKEKNSFTDDWMKEPLSIGAFYIKNSNDFFEAINEMVLANERVANEFYPSLAFNRLIDAQKTVGLCYVANFVHLGTPAQYRDFMNWAKFNNRKSDNKSCKVQPTTVGCVLLGGNGSRLKEFVKEPKHLISVGQNSMINEVLSSISCEQNIVVAGPETLLPERLVGATDVVIIPRKSKSAVDTLNLALGELPTDKGILLLSCDCFGFFDTKAFERLTDDETTECVVFCFKKSLLQTKLSNQHTTIKTEKGLVTFTDIKDKKRQYPECLAGFFWFRNKGIIQDLISNVLHQEAKIELHIDHLIKYLCEQKRYPKYLSLENYTHLGTPFELEEHRYWTTRGASLFDDVNRDKV